MNTTRSIRSQICTFAVLISLCFFPRLAMAQTEKDSTGTGKAEVSIELAYTIVNNHSKMVTATVKTKVDDTYQAIKGVNVNFYQKEAAPEYLLGAATSNDKGVVIFVLSGEQQASLKGENTFIAAVENSDTYEDALEEVTVTDAEFNMSLQEEDSVRQVLISLQTVDAAGNQTPVGEAEVHLYVQRMFGLLPLSADPETTDENGEVVVDFPAGIPGDSAGNLVIVAKIEDHERFGNMEFRRKINWGVPLVIDPNRDKRQLWSSRANAPLYLIVIINSMLIGIWGVIGYIVFQVFKIRKIGKQSTT